MRSVTETISKLVDRSQLDRSYEGAVALAKARSIAKAHGINLGLFTKPASTITPLHVQEDTAKNSDNIAYDWCSGTWYDCKTMKTVPNPYSRDC